MGFEFELVNYGAKFGGALWVPVEETDPAFFGGIAGDD
jgi:hypothetical protein